MVFRPVLIQKRQRSGICARHAGCFGPAMRQVREFECMRVCRYKGFRANSVMEFIDAVLAHHGKPVAAEDQPGDRDLWLPKNAVDPLDTIKDLGRVARTKFPKAFEEDGEIVPDTRLRPCVRGPSQPCRLDRLGSTDFSSP